MVQKLCDDNTLPVRYSINNAQYKQKETITLVGLVFIFISIVS